MSAHTRDVFRQALAAAAAPVLYIETIAQAVDLNTAPGIWVSLEFPQVVAERVALGYPACMRESGSVVVHVIARSGEGDGAAFALAEQLRPFFEGPYLSDVRLTGTQPPTLAPTDNGNWIDVFFSVYYAWDYVVNRVTA